MTRIELAEHCLRVTIGRYWRFRDNPGYDKERLMHRIEVARRYLERQRRAENCCPENADE